MSGGDPEDGIHAHYDLTHELGKGSFATVMKAIERRTGEWFAVKIITDKHNRPGDQNRVAFTREIEIMKKLKHPNICELKEVFYQANGISEYQPSRYARKRSISVRTSFWSLSRVETSFNIFWIGMDWVN